MRVSLNKKVFLVFFPLTAMTLILGLTVCLGILSYHRSTKQIDLLRNFQLQVKSLEIWQARLPLYLKPIDIKELRSEIQAIERTAEKISSLTDALPASLLARLQKISFHMEKFQLAFLELHEKYIATRQAEKENLDIIPLFEEKIHESSAELDSDLHNIMSHMVILESQVLLRKDASKIPELKQLQNNLISLNSDQHLIDLNQKFIANIEKNMFLSLAIKNRQEFLAETSDLFFRIAHETIDAVDNQIQALQRRLFLAIGIIALLSISLSLFLWSWTHNYFKRFLANQQLAIKSIERADYDYEVSEAAEDEIGDLTRTLKRLSISVKESQQETQESEEKYRSLVENLSDWIWEVNPQGRYSYTSPSVEKMLGFSKEEIIGKTPYDFTAKKEVISQSRPQFIHYLREKKPFQVMENTITKKDGKIVFLESSGLPIFNEQGHFLGFRGVSRDITERKQAESLQKNLELQLQQSQKMESIGRLAGGVAHDFNNILSAITGYSELILLRMAEDDPFKGEVQIILKSGQRAARLTQQLLAFSRRQIIEPELLDLNKEIKETQKMLSRVLGEDVEISIFAHKGLWAVMADRSQIEQVIVNLAVNARDAMVTGGKLTIETSNVSLEANYTASHFFIEPGDYVLLSISDTGCGMTKEIQENIFEPFFTTKEKGKGTGLGLAMVYGIIKQNKGDIHIYSEPGKGTTFKIYLPRCKELVPFHEREQETASLHTARGHETIMLVEDDKTVRGLVIDILSRQGYTVLEAEDGPDALKTFSRYHGNIDLLLTDVVMPQMGGPELADQIGKISPQTRVLFMSGYTENAIVHHGVLKAGVNFLHKPISPTSLSLAVRKLLDS